VLDAEWLHEVVTAAKAPEAEVVQRYADMIPKMIKALTPRGEIPSARVLAAGFEAMRRRSASRAS